MLRNRGIRCGEGVPTSWYPLWIQNSFLISRGRRQPADGGLPGLNHRFKLNRGCTVIDT